MRVLVQLVVPVPVRPVAVRVVVPEPGPPARQGAELAPAPGLERGQPAARRASS